MATIFDLTTAQVDRIIEMVAVDASRVATMTDLTNLRSTLRNDLLNAATTQSRSLSGGTLTPVRVMRLDYVLADTEGFAAADTCTLISTTGYNQFDMLFIKPTSQARVLTFQDEAVTGLSNMKLRSSTATLYGPAAFLILMLVGTYWVEVARYAAQDDFLNTRNVTLVRKASIADTGALDCSNASQIDAYGEYTGEVSATLEITIGAPGASGDIDLQIDEGLGVYSIGSYSYSGSPTEAAVRAAYTGVINGGTAVHGWVAVDTGAVVELTAPAGSGNMANGWTTTLIPEGDSVAAITTAIAGGVDGTPAADTITDITGLFFNQRVLVTNQNPSGVLTFDTTGNILGATDRAWKINPGESIEFVANENSEVAVASWTAPDPCVRCARVVLSSAQIRALFTTPQTLVPAQGAGTYIVPISVLTYYNFNTVAYTLGVGSIGRIYVQGAGTNRFETADAFWLTQVVDSWEDVAIQPPSNSQFTTVNAPLLIDVDIADPTLGDGTLTIWVTYKVLTP